MAMVIRSQPGENHKCRDIAEETQQQTDDSGDVKSKPKMQARRLVGAPVVNGEESGPEITDINSTIQDPGRAIQESQRLGQIQRIGQQQQTEGDTKHDQRVRGDRVMKKVVP
jgi:hypothetical protein